MHLNGEFHKIKKLNELINTVAMNTKRISEGKPPKSKLEDTKLKVVLKEMLGRNPSIEELEVAKAEFSPTTSAQ